MINFFCAKCQKITAHKPSVEPNGEFMLRCQNDFVPEVVDDKGDVTVEAVPCDRFVKFAPDTTLEELQAYADVHQAANEGQVSLEKQEDTLAKFVASQQEVKPEVAPELVIPTESTV